MECWNPTECHLRHNCISSCDSFQCSGICQKGSWNQGGFSINKIYDRGYIYCARSNTDGNNIELMYFTGLQRNTTEGIYKGIGNVCKGLSLRLLNIYHY